MKTYKGLRGGGIETQQALSRVQGRSLPPPLAAAATIALAVLASLMLVAASCSVAKL